MNPFSWLLPALLLAVPAAPKVIEGVAVVVGPQIILVSDLQQKMQPYMKQVCQMPEGVERDRAMEDIWHEAMKDEIAMVLMEVEAQKHNIYVDSTELNATIEMLVKQNRLENLVQLQEKLEAQNYPYLLWRKDVRRQLLRSRLMNEVVKLTVNVEEQAIRSFYQQKLREVNAEERASVRELFVPDREATPALIEAIDKAIAARTPFGELVTAHSRARTASTGGLRAEVVPGTYTPAVDQLLFPKTGKAPVEGAILGPVRTTAGVWYLEILERVESGYLPYDQVRAKLKEELTARLINQKGMEWLMGLQNKYLVDRQMPKPPAGTYCR
jgi:peptidyl-prolyl cis-trans isomerase SurA